MQVYIQMWFMNFFILLVVDCSALPYLNKDQLQRVLNALPTDIPLKVVANAISDEGFWQRMTLSRWPVVDVVKHGNSWKRAFFEKYLEQIIHEYVPGHTYSVWIEEALELGAPFIRRLDIREMLPGTMRKSRNTWVIVFSIVLPQYLLEKNKMQVLTRPPSMIHLHGRKDITLFSHSGMLIRIKIRS